MSKFTTPAILEMLNSYKWKVYEPFEYYVNDDGTDIIYVPKGYITDLTSVPRLLWVVFPPHGKYAKAAIVHDYLYDGALRTKHEADEIFYNGMLVLGVPKWKAYILYLGAKLFGKGNY